MGRGGVKLMWFCLIVETTNSIYIEGSLTKLQKFGINLKERDILKDVFRQVRPDRETIFSGPSNIHY